VIIINEFKEMTIGNLPNQRTQMLTRNFYNFPIQNCKISDPDMASLGCGILYDCLTGHVSEESFQSAAGVASDSIRALKLAIKEEFNPEAEAALKYLVRIAKSIRKTCQTECHKAGQEPWKTYRCDEYDVHGYELRKYRGKNPTAVTLEEMSSKLPDKNELQPLWD